MSNTVKHDLLNNVPVVGSVSAAVDLMMQSVRRLFGHSQGQAIAEAIRDGLHEYVKVADKFGVARLIEAQVKFLEAAARFEEARAAARRADADYLRAEALHEFVTHVTHGADGALTPSDAAAFQTQALQDILLMLQEFAGNHIADFDAIIAQPLLQLLPTMTEGRASALPRPEMDVPGE